MKKANRGFIALMSVLVISVVLLTTMVSLSYFGLTSRFVLLDLEHKGASEKLAEACVAVGIISLVNDPMATMTGTVVPVGTRQCILTILPGVGDRTLQASAETEGATTNLQVEVRPTASTMEEVILTWRELPTL